MRHSSDLIGKPVVTMDEGRFLGNVKDVFLDEGLNWLAGVYLGKEGFLRRKQLLIPREAVVVFGVDAILVNDADVVSDDRETKEASSWIRLDSLRKRSVNTPGGTKVGVAGDVVLDGEARIIGFELSKVYVSGPIADERFIPRAALIDTGEEDGIMTVDLAKAERQKSVVGGQ